MLAGKVIGYEIESSALQPTVKVHALVTSGSDKRLYAYVGTCDVYFGKYQSPYNKQLHITSTANVLNAWVNASGSFEFSTSITFTQELIERLDKLKAVEEDLHLTLKHHIQFFTINQESKVEQTYYDTTVCDFAIKMSDWAKIAAAWGKDVTLVPLSPKTYERIKELRKIYKHLRSDDDVINELIDLHTKSQN